MITKTLNKNLKQTVTGFRGDILHFISNPSETDRVEDSYKFFKDGLLIIEDGKVKDLDFYEKLSNVYSDAKIIDYSDQLIVPGLIDAHIHFPQLEMIASYGNQLLDWLNQYTFPTEGKYSDYEYSKSKAKIFIDEMINHGTTSAAVYATVSPNSVNALFSEALDRNMRIISGKVMMDRNAPEYLLDTPEESYIQSKELIEKWHNKGRLLYAVTPRFAVSSTEKQLQVASRLMDEYPTVYMQTHLAENKEECEFVGELFPRSKTYLDVYESLGLVRDKSIFGHSIYLSNDNFKLLGEKGSSIAFCPTSNLFLGSGLFDLQYANKHKVKVGLGTDVGGGRSMSLLKTMQEGYSVTQLQKVFNSDYKKSNPLSAFEAFYLATLGSAKALNIENNVGSFRIGNEADFIVLDPTKPSELSQKGLDSSKLEELLFSLSILGNQETIKHVYIMGKQHK